MTPTDPKPSLAELRPDTELNQEAPYSRKECEESDGGHPDRGLYCPKCGARIPQFADLSESDEHRIRKLICNGQHAMATRELAVAASCPLEWAKIWVVHAGRPTPEFPGPPCPYCQKPLRTTLAKQCPHCLMDWHDPENPRNLTDR